MHKKELHHLPVYLFGFLQADVVYVMDVDYFFVFFIKVQVFRFMPGFRQVFCQQLAVFKKKIIPAGVYEDRYC